MKERVASSTAGAHLWTGLAVSASGGSLVKAGLDVSNGAHGVDTNDDSSSKAPAADALAATPTYFRFGFPGLAEPSIVVSATAVGLVALLCLVVQNCASVLIMRWCLTRPDARPFSRTSAILLGELLKLAVCAIVMVVTKLPVREVRGGDPVKLVVPASLYSLQHYLLFIALADVDSSTFQVLYQTKVLLTAGLMVLILGHRISRFKWLSLCVLFFGVVLTQMSPSSPSSPAVAMHAKANSPTGLAAVVASSFSSALSSVYLEKLMKQTSAGLVVRNVQLSLIGGALCVCVYVVVEGRAWGTFMDGIDGAVWAVIWIQAAGGLIVAAVIKYADNIMKTFATSVSIVIGGVCGYFLFDLRPSAFFVCGAGLVVVASAMYGWPERPTGLAALPSPRLEEDSARPAMSASATLPSGAPLGATRLAP